MKNKLTVKVEKEITNEDLSMILISMVESNGMSPCWSRFDGNESYDYGDHKTAEAAKEFAGNWGFDTYCEYGYLPALEGGSAILMQHHEDGGDTIEVIRFDRPALLKGLELMAEQFPKNFANLLDDYDEIDLDILLQLALLREVIYG